METLMEIIENMNFAIGIVFMVCYSYQLFYILVPFIIRRRPHKETVMHHIAVLISARNESAVIGQLIDSISAQDYDADYLTVFVVADNCTDNTADVAREHGAVVFERQNKQLVGKGYALEFLLKSIDENPEYDKIEAFVVLDADNLLEPNYMTEMNKSYSDGHKIITSYRNSKNYGDNWISAGYSLWFIRESKYLNNSRALLGTSCAVSGTGFLFDRELIREEGGWCFHTLTEDIEFTTHSICKGVKVGYCYDAMLYDEQPVKFSQSWKQRLRWARGFLQVIKKYGFKLIGGIFKNKGARFSCYDMLMTLAPAYILSTTSIISTIAGFIISVINGFDQTSLWESVFWILWSGYVLVFLIGLLTVITERKKIHASTFKKILYLFTFPIFMYTYIPISIVALFKKVGWTPIQHTKSVSVTEVKNS